MRSTWESLLPIILNVYELIPHVLGTFVDTSMYVVDMVIAVRLLTIDNGLNLAQQHATVVFNVVIFELVAADVQRDRRLDRRALKLGPNREFFFWC